MKKSNLIRVLSALVAECGYDTVRKALEKNQPAPSPAVADTRVNPGTKKRRRPNAVRFVETLQLTDGEKKRTLERLADKYEQKTFMPNVNHVRIFLEESGADVFRIKSRQEATIRVFKHLAELSQDEMLEVERNHAPKSVGDIAEAIHAFGEWRRGERREP